MKKRGRIVLTALCLLLTLAGRAETGAPETYDAVIASSCVTDRIAVLYKGNIVELAETETLFRHPLHPYTRSLLSSVPIPNPIVERNKEVLVYDPECHHYSKTEPPKWVEIEPGHFIHGSDRELDDYRRVLSREA